MPHNVAGNGKIEQYFWKFFFQKYHQSQFLVILVTSTLNTSILYFFQFVLSTMRQLPKGYYVQFEMELWNLSAKSCLSPFTIQLMSIGMLMLLFFSVFFSKCVTIFYVNLCWLMWYLCCMPYLMCLA